MHKVICCPVCEGRARKELLTFPNDKYLRRLPTRADHTVRYAICTACGFVYQPQTMDEAEMAVLYGEKYRLTEPPSDYLRGNRCVALQVFSWITERTGLRGPGRKVLDIGCATGMFLRPFTMAGWTAIGCDAASSWIEYGRREFGLDLRAEFFTKDSFPGEQFDLIVFSHVLEHVLDPAPILGAIRERLADGGFLFIGTPSILAPRRKLYPGLFGGDHVRLFSPRTIRAYLRRHGFQPVAVETHSPRGLRVLAVKAERATEPDLRDRDDWGTIMALYRGLFSPSGASCLERNLAALVDRQEPVLEEVCRRFESGPYEIRSDGTEPDNVLIRRRDGAATWLYGREGSRFRARLLLERARDRVAASDGPVLLRGFGLGHFAELLEAALRPSASLHIWEPDPAMLLTALRIRDLTNLVRSPQVTLHVGTSVDFLKTLASEKGGGPLRSLLDPQSSSARDPFHEELPFLFKDQQPSWSAASHSAVCSAT